MPIEVHLVLCQDRPFVPPRGPLTVETGPVLPRKFAVQADLGLGPEIVVQTGEDDYQVVSRIDRLGHHPCVIGRLSTLNISDHQAGQFYLGLSRSQAFS